MSIGAETHRGYWYEVQQSLPQLAVQCKHAVWLCQRHSMRITSPTASSPRGYIAALLDSSTSTPAPDAIHMLFFQYSHNAYSSADVDMGKIATIGIVATVPSALLEGLSTLIM